MVVPRQRQTTVMELSAAAIAAHGTKVIGRQDRYNPHKPTWGD